MTLRVKFTPGADAEFLAVIRYRGAYSPSAALDFRDKALRALSRLRDFPESGRTLPEYPYLPFREVIVAPFRFFYQVEHGTVWTAAIWHDAQLVDVPPNEVGVDCDVRAHDASA